MGIGLRGGWLIGASSPEWDARGKGETGSKPSAPRDLLDRPEDEGRSDSQTLNDEVLME